MSKYERTGWRDPELDKRHKIWGFDLPKYERGISNRHRCWGNDCPMVDIDFLVAEYDHCVPVAIIEYKNEHAEIKDDANCKTLVRLADMCRLPLFRVVYASEFNWWEVEALNGFAKSKLAKKSRMSEKQYVIFLYWLRGKKLPSNLFDGEKLRNEK